MPKKVDNSEPFNEHKMMDDGLWLCKIFCDECESVKITKQEDFRRTLLEFCDTHVRMGHLVQHLEWR